MTTPDLGYIAQNLDLLDEYKLRDLEEKIKAKDLTKRHGVHVSESGVVGTTEIRLDLRNKSVADLSNDLAAAIGKTFGGMDFKAFDRLGWVVKNNYLRHTEGNAYHIGGNYEVPHLVEFLWYVLDGTMNDDLREAHQFCDTHDAAGETCNERDPARLHYQHAYKLVIKHGTKGNSVLMQKFKNGKVVLKFSDPGDETKAQELLSAWNAKRHA